MNVLRTRLGKATIVCASAVALSMTATPAHAAVYATGTFSYVSQGTDVCVEAYAGTSLGLQQCAVSLSIGTFALVVNHNDGTCSGIAPATLSISSPSTPSAPPAEGLIVVSHGVGRFDGEGVNELIVSFADATVTGSRCKPEVVGDTRSLNGKYELVA